MKPTAEERIAKAADRIAKCKGELEESLLLLGIAATSAAKSVKRACGAFVDQHKAEGGNCETRL